MVLKKVFLDYLYRESLERLAIDAKWITTDYNGDPVESSGVHSPVFGGRNSLRARTLLIATLFEQIDSDYSGFDVSRLVSEGIVPANATMLDSRPRLWFYDPKYVPDNERDMIGFSHASALKLMRSFKARIVRFHLRRYPSRYDGSSGDFGTPSEISELYDWILDDFEIAENDKPYLYSYIQDLKGMFWNIEECIYFSCKNRHAFASPLARQGKAELSTTPNAIEDVYCIAETRLSNEVVVLPHPMTLEDVLAMRNAKEIRRFREVLSAWCDSLREGDSATEQRMRNDIRKANKELIRLKKWRKYERSPINFLLNSIGGHIPILSNILTLVASVTRMWEYHVEKKHNWIMLGAVPPQSP